MPFRCEVCFTVSTVQEVQCWSCSSVESYVVCEDDERPKAGRRSEARRAAARGDALGDEAGPLPDVPSSSRKPLQAQQLADIDTPMIERLPTHDAGVDLVTGGGFVKGRVYALYSDAGAGKSRLARRIAANLCRLGRVCWFASSHEEPIEEVKRALEESGLMKLPHVRARLTLYPDADDTDEIVDVIDDVNPVFTVLDSLSTVTSADCSSEKAQPRYAAYLLRGLSRAHDTTVLAMAHRTKDGPMSGDHKLSYLVDGIVKLDRVRPTSTGYEVSEEATRFVRLCSTGKIRRADPTAVAYYEHGTADLKLLRADVPKIEKTPTPTPEPETTPRREGRKRPYPRPRS